MAEDPYRRPTDGHPSTLRSADEAGVMISRKRPFYSGMLSVLFIAAILATSIACVYLYSLDRDRQFACLQFRQDASYYSSFLAEIDGVLRESDRKRVNMATVFDSIPKIEIHAPSNIASVASNIVSVFRGNLNFDESEIFRLRGKFVYEVRLADPC